MRKYIMRCPLCGTTLAAFEEHRLHLDRCPEGHGIWFDGGELEAYRKNHSDTEKPSREEAHCFQPFPGETVKDCPRCRRTTLEPGHLYKLNLYHCMTCHGVFLGQPMNIRQEDHDSIGVEGIEIGSSIIEIIVTAFG